MKAVIAYLSYSGNTEEVANLIDEKLGTAGFTVDMHRIGIDPPVHAESYDFLFLGTFTWEYGRIPDEVKDFILEVGYKPENVAIFGTGDTQFGGDDLYCCAVDRLCHFYQSKWQGLKIEQSPRGSQEVNVEKWVEGVIQNVPVIA